MKNCCFNAILTKKNMDFADDMEKRCKFAPQKR